MSDQFTAPLFVEDLFTALTDVVRALGGFRAVGARMKPEIPADEAGRWLSNCLNRNKRDRLSLDQIMWLLQEGRRVGCHTAMHYMATSAGYTEPVPVEPEDEQARLQRAYIAAVGELAKIARSMEELQGRRSLKVA